MKNYLFLISFVLFTSFGFAQSNKEEIEKFQKELNEEYKNPNESPLKKSDLKKFKSLDFFPINDKYRVEAKFIVETNPLTFQMPTTTDRLPEYQKYAEVVFDIDGKEYRLEVYQNQKLKEKKEYVDYLFIPFTDLTNGEESYDGGRYLDLRIPEGDTIILDFNKAYNPYCAYNSLYSCPIPPDQNNLNMRMEAGVKKWK
ncbi:DUF1684 domain-containing protein [Aureivirga sp. CE67]|uniref:DUF1684 domain-containing protein n=1 Tax=Aureivirga sp. CE67 TaxID=1788983 RepID=UPI0018CBA6B1|nr:DUF1684 domain-containing protein [Aureivirga sp. CE67]